MPRKAWGLTVLLLITLLVFAGLLALSWLRIRPATVPGEVVAGKRVWQKYGCVECHTILGNGGYVGPDLTHVAGSRQEKDLRRFLTTPARMRPHARRRHPPVKPTEVEALMAYFYFLDRLQVKGWPPRTVLETEISAPDPDQGTREGDQE